MLYKKSLTSSLTCRSWLGICLFLIAACEPAIPNTPVPKPTCVSLPPEANPYISHELSESIKNIYLYSLSNNHHLEAKQDALSLLGENTEHWSDRVDIAIDESQMVRIVITYLDPILIQYIVLNHVLSNQGFQNVSTTPEADTEFDKVLKRVMKNLGERNEMLFIVTITTPFYREQAYNSNVLTVRIPIERMELISTADVRLTPTHEDHILDKSIDITHGPVHGFVGYPIAIMDQTQCILVMDKYTTTLTLDVPYISLGSTQFDSKFWSIPYHPLVMEENSHPVPTVDPHFDFSRNSQLATPPTPHWVPNAKDDETDWDLYWQEMGRYIWNVVITASHH